MKIKLFSLILSIVLLISLTSCRGIFKKELNKMEQIVEGTTGVPQSETFKEKKLNIKESSKYSVSKETYTVSYVIDGDTFKCYNKTKMLKVRLIGIDTPESVHSVATRNCEYGKTASDYTKRLLLNKSVTLSYDEEKYDRYGRTLAYVYLGENFINNNLVENGYPMTKQILVRKK